MPEETYDESLFNSAEEAAEAAALFGAGKEASEKGQPVGQFQVEIMDALLGRSQSSDKLQITYKLKIVVGPMSGETLVKYDGLGKDTQVKMSLDQLKRLGVETKNIDLSKLPAVLLTLKGTKAVVKAQQNGEYYNIFFQKAIKTITPGTTTPSGVKPKAKF